MKTLALRCLLWLSGVRDPTARRLFARWLASRDGRAVIRFLPLGLHTLERIRLNGDFPDIGHPRLRRALSAKVASFRGNLQAGEAPSHVIANAVVSIVDGIDRHDTESRTIRPSS